MTITYETAIALLQNNPADATTKEALLKLVRDISLEVADGFAQGRVTVLDSGDPIANIGAAGRVALPRAAWFALLNRTMNSMGPILISQNRNMKKHFEY